MPPPERIFQEKRQHLVVPGLCGAFILIGLALMLSGWERIQNARTSAHWPTVRGVIVTADAYPIHTSEGRRWRPIITYKYLARGRELTGTRLSLQEPATGYDERTARQIVSRYRLQTPVTVYYNPERFTEAVLEQSVPRSAYISVGLGALFALPGSGLVMVIGMTIGGRQLGALRRRWARVEHIATRRHRRPHAVPRARIRSGMPSDNPRTGAARHFADSAPAQRAVD
jgi:hypothetical protein